MKPTSCIILGLTITLAAVTARYFLTTTPQADTTDNDALECIMTRTSVREYADKQVPDSVIEKILRAGMAAPTAANKQPWHFVVIKNQAIKDSIVSDFKYAKMVGNSAFDIVVCGNMSSTMDSDTPTAGNWVLDCSAASENMLLAAHAQGVGAVWCGVYPEADRIEILSRILALPDTLVPLNIISFGYPKAATSPKDKWDETKISYKN